MSMNIRYHSLLGNLAKGLVRPTFEKENKQMELTDRQRLERMEEDARILRLKLEAEDAIPTLKLGEEGYIMINGRSAGVLTIDEDTKKVYVNLFSDIDGDWKAKNGETPDIYVYTSRR